MQQIEIKSTSNHLKILLLKSFKQSLEEQLSK